MIVHHEYDLKPIYFKNVFIQLFEFIHYFHQKHTGKELHDFIDKKLWRTEAELLSGFENKWVLYRGKNVVNYHPIEIVTAQKYNCLRLKTDQGYKYYERYKYGSELLMGPFSGECPDCAVEPGEYHTFYCDIETCPICDWQLLGCKCEGEYWIQKDHNLTEDTENINKTEQQATIADGENVGGVITAKFITPPLSSDVKIQDLSYASDLSHHLIQNRMVWTRLIKPL
ncbi:MAG: hypothetical protein GY799_07745 [Desulfobulbaceae bacterium]|nr:hypothetical protein [Desulfobulbaceae bacterium]